MKELLTYVLSPAGLALYAMFWAVKLVFGAWILRRISGFLPDVITDWVGDRFSALKSRAGLRSSAE
jgi:hypothetical protein